MALDLYFREQSQKWHLTYFQEQKSEKWRELTSENRVKSGTFTYFREQSQKWRELTSENKKVKLTSENKGPFVLVGAKDCPLWLCRGIANVVHQVLHKIFVRQQKTSRNLIRFPDPLFGATVGEPDVKMNLPLLGACQ